MEIVKFEQGFFFNFAGFRSAGIGKGLPNSTVEFPDGVVTRATPGPPATVTVKPQLVRFPPGSVAVHATVVTPSVKAEPDAGAQVTTAPGRLSVTVGAG